MTLKDLERVRYFEYSVVVEPGLTALKMHQLLTEYEFLSAQDEFGEDSFEAMIGAEAMKKMLSSLELEEERTVVREELRDTGSEAKRKKLVKRLKLIAAFLESGARPAWMIRAVVPVLPPELRPLVPLAAGPFETSYLAHPPRPPTNPT